MKLETEPTTTTNNYNLAAVLVHKIAIILKSSGGLASSNAAYFPSFYPNPIPQYSLNLPVIVRL